MTFLAQPELYPSEELMDQGGWRIVAQNKGSDRDVVVLPNIPNAFGMAVVRYPFKLHVRMIKSLVRPLHFLNGSPNGGVIIFTLTVIDEGDRTWEGHSVEFRFHKYGHASRERYWMRHVRSLGEPLLRIGSSHEHERCGIRVGDGVQSPKSCGDADARRRCHRLRSTLRKNTNANVSQDGLL
jgi:hypothetical protein